MLESFLFSVDAGGTSRRSKDLQNLIVLVRYPSKRIQQQGCIKLVKLVKNVEKKHMATALIGGRGREVGGKH